MINLFILNKFIRCRGKPIRQQQKNEIRGDEASGGSHSRNMSYTKSLHEVLKFASYDFFNSEEIRRLLSNVFDWNKDKLN